MKMSFVQRIMVPMGHGEGGRGTGWTFYGCSETILNAEFNGVLWGWGSLSRRRHAFWVIYGACTRGVQLGASPAISGRTFFDAKIIGRNESKEEKRERNMR